MKAKTKRIIVITSFALTIIVIAYTLTTLLESAEATKTTPVEEVASLQNPGKTSTEVEIYPAIEAVLPYQTTMSDLTLEVLDFAWRDGQAWFTVKFPLIDGRDWQIRKAYLATDSQKYSLWGTMLVEMLLPPEDGSQQLLIVTDGMLKESVLTSENQPAYRIDQIAFGDVPSDLDQIAFTLVIQEINAIPDEIDYCGQRTEDAIQKAMSAQYAGIQIECVSEPGYLSYRIVPGTTFAENSTAIEALDAVKGEQLNGMLVGPWAFDFGK